MIRKPNGYEEAAAYDGSGMQQVTPGGHIVEIVSAREEMVNLKGGGSTPKFVIAFDIKEGGELDGFYLAKYKRDKENDPYKAKWRGTYDTFMEKDGKTNPFFKGLITSIEKSNGFTWNWDEKTLVRKQLGLIFREEEYLGTDGKKYKTCRPFAARSVEDIRKGVPVPEPKLLPVSDVNGYAYDAPAGGFTQADDDELPF